MVCAKPARIDSFHGVYRFLSNFHPCRVEFEGLTFPSVEHAYQAAKSTFPERRIPFTISGGLSSSEAKSKGNELPLRSGWGEIKLDVMRQLLEIKFDLDQNPTLAYALYNTGDAHLIEGNTWKDYFWGVCSGVGENHLGRILMEIRSSLATRINVVDLD